MLILCVSQSGESEGDGLVFEQTTVSPLAVSVVLCFPPTSLLTSVVCRVEGEGGRLRSPLEFWEVQCNNL